MAAASLAKKARASMKDRTIRVLVSPAPITFTERRSVLQVLEEYGAVEVFRMHPNREAHFISVTKESKTADKLVAASPLAYTLSDSPSHGDIRLADLEDPPDQASYAVETSFPRSGLKLEAEPAADRVERKSIKLEIFPAKDFSHEFTDYHDRLRHPWPHVWKHDRSFMAATLKQSIPQTIAAQGLRHWLMELDDGPISSGKMHYEWRRRLKSWLPSHMRG